MTIEEPTELVRRSIYHATFLDGANGGSANDMMAVRSSQETMLKSFTTSTIQSNQQFLNRKWGKWWGPEKFGKHSAIAVCTPTSYIVVMLLENAKIRMVVMLLCKRVQRVGMRS